VNADVRALIVKNLGAALAAEYRRRQHDRDDDQVQHVQLQEEIPGGKCRTEALTRDRPAV
jgi:hypothetical protein